MEWAIASRMSSAEAPPPADAAELRRAAPEKKAFAGATRRRGRLIRPAAVSVTMLALKFIALMMVGLMALLLAVLWVADLRTGAVDVVARSLIEQADTVQSALRAKDRIVTSAGLSRAAEDETSRADLTELVARLTEGSGTRVRIFDIEGRVVADNAGSANVDGPVRARRDNLLAGLFDTVMRAVMTPHLATEPADAAGAADLPEVTAALGGIKSVAQRMTAQDDVRVSVAAPLRDSAGAVVGVLHLRSGPGVVSDLARRQERDIAGVFLVTACGAVVAAFVLAVLVTRPLRRLAAEAERVRTGGFSGPIPMLYYSGEVGELSRVLHEMTETLCKRIGAIESFAGEVTHELKNPLTSLRSAVETLPLVTSEAARSKLLDVIQHDIRRIDRLISDISDASKLDAELNRSRFVRCQLASVLSSVIGAQADLAARHNQSVEMVMRGDAATYVVMGSEGRLRQVFDNLLDNARSFTPDGGRIVATAQRFGNFIEVMIDDEGPGIAEEALERIFERFYTDRPDPANFGNNSGLGLAISRQIVEAVKGEIFAENRYRPARGDGHEIAGARFTVRLPAAP